MGQGYWGWFDFPSFPEAGEGTDPSSPCGQVEDRGSAGLFPGFLKLLVRCKVNEKYGLFPIQLKSPVWPRIQYHPWRPRGSPSAPSNLKLRGLARSQVGQGWGWLRVRCRVKREAFHTQWPKIVGCWLIRKTCLHTEIGTTYGNCFKQLTLLSWITALFWGPWGCKSLLITDFHIVKQLFKLLIEHIVV